METRCHDRRLIAIDLRSQQFGYAVFDGPRGLLDYGGGQLRPGGKAGALLAGKRIALLIRQFAPSAIAVMRPDKRVIESRPGIRLIVKAVERAAERDLVPCRVIGREDVRAAFAGFGARNKFQIASVLARLFPELERKLPPERTLGNPEHPRMVIFDAISVGVTYWHQTDAKSQLPA